MQDEVNYSSKDRHRAHNTESHDILRSIGRRIQVCAIDRRKISQSVDNSEANCSGLVGHSAKRGRCKTQAERIASPNGGGHEDKEDIASNVIVYKAEDDGADRGDDKTTTNDHAA